MCTFAVNHKGLCMYFCLILLSIALIVTLFYNKNLSQTIENDLVLHY